MFKNLNVWHYLVVAFCFVVEVMTIRFLWLWFLTPIGVPAIGFFHVIGLILLKTLFMPDSFGVVAFTKKLEGEGQSPARMLEEMLPPTVLILSVGFLLHFFI